MSFAVMALVSNVTAINLNQEAADNFDSQFIRKANKEHDENDNSYQVEAKKAEAAAKKAF